MTAANPAQADIDSDVAAISAVFTSLGGIFTQLQALVAAAQTANAPVDTAALDALVTSGQGVLTEFQGLTPPAS